jgi:hypothetical protein
MLKLMEAAMIAGLAFTYIPSLGAIEAEEFRVTMDGNQYKILDLCGYIDSRVVYTSDTVAVVRHIMYGANR